MHSDTLRFRLALGLVAALGASLIAGCCGGPFGANGGEGCVSCVHAKPCPDVDAEAVDGTTD